MTGRVLLFTVLFAGSLSAQVDNQTTANQTTALVTIHIVPTSGVVCDASTRVTLIGVSAPVAAGSPNRDCDIVLSNVPAGHYHLNVSGVRVTAFDAGTIQLDSARPQEVKLKISLPGERRVDALPASYLVGIADLKIPSKAREEFKKATELIGKQDFAKAIQRLDKAIAICPSYAGAYTNLAVAYARLGDLARESEALQKALSINDQFAPAYLNLGRMNIAAGNFSDAEAQLEKASTLDPTDPMPLAVLAYAEYMDQQLDAAIATSRKAHKLDKAHAFGHRVAASAFEQKRDGTNAIAELELFLQEEPAGPRADAVRKELETVKGIVQQVTVNRGFTALPAP
jgi:cytochrome c-type biogenesis protein CcmH/NrfG